MKTEKKYRTIALISAMDKEVDVESLFKGAAYEKIERCSLIFHSYLFDNGVRVFLAISGIGEIAAAYTTAVMVSLFSPDCIINFGVVGGLRDVPALVLVSDVVHYDLDLTPFGNALGCYDGFSSPFISSDTSLSQAIMDKIQAKTTFVRIASGDKFVASKEKKLFLLKTFNADICDMESAGIAYTATKMKVPFAMLKLVSDMADDNAFDSYNSFFKYGEKLYVNAISDFIRAQ